MINPKAVPPKSPKAILPPKPMSASGTRNTAMADPNKADERTIIY